MGFAIVVVNCIVLNAFLGACVQCYSAISQYWNVEVRNTVCDISTVHRFDDTRTEFQKFILKTIFFL